jgi:NAD(P)-dependent dehydrogenase (short-subunit alcohol dehydrogenase family)
MPGVAVVTGAASGLGAAIAGDVSGRGWRVPTPWPTYAARTRRRWWDS